eukprot:2478391-Pleurochrysis_carterae.AAC.1
MHPMADARIPFATAETPRVSRSRVAFFVVFKLLFYSYINADKFDLALSSRRRPRVACRLPFAQPASRASLRWAAARRGSIPPRSPLCVKHK